MFGRAFKFVSQELESPAVTFIKTLDQACKGISDIPDVFSVGAYAPAEFHGAVALIYNAASAGLLLPVTVDIPTASFADTAVFGDLEVSEAHSEALRATDGNIPFRPLVHVAFPDLFDQGVAVFLQADRHLEVQDILRGRDITRQKREENPRE